MNEASQRTCQYCHQPFVRAPRSRSTFCSRTCAEARHTEQRRGQRLTPRLPVSAGYEHLASILDEALAQAQSGKGRDRHASGEPFIEQPIVRICQDLGSPQFAIGQANKKSREALRLSPGAGRAELLGAINYLAAAVLVIDRSAR